MLIFINDTSKKNPPTSLPIKHTFRELLKNVIYRGGTAKGGGMLIKDKKKDHF